MARALGAVDAGGQRLPPPQERTLQLGRAVGVSDGVRIIDDQPVGTGTRAHAADGGSSPPAPALVLEHGLGVLVVGKAQRPEPLEPRALHQELGAAIVPDAEPVGVAEAEEAVVGEALRSPLPGRPEDGGQQGLGRARGHVDQQAPDLARRDGLQVLADGLDDAAVQVGRAGLQHGPALADELAQGGGAEEPLDLSRIADCGRQRLDQVRGQHRRSARSRSAQGALGAARRSTWTGRAGG